MSHMCVDLHCIHPPLVLNPLMLRSNLALYCFHIEGTGKVAHTLLDMGASANFVTQGWIEDTGIKTVPIKDVPSYLCSFLM